MAKTTYLLGAGASAGSLPMVNQFESKIRELIDLFDLYLDTQQSTIETLTNGKNVCLKVKIDLEFLLEGCRSHRSVDTFAKMLFLTDNKSDYHRLKCVIVLFFELCRFYYQETDKRYDAFLATLLENNDDELIKPDNVNILSWNYDYEFERAFIKYVRGVNDINDIPDHLNILDKHSKDNRSIANRFGIVKINGTAGFYHNGKLILGLDCYENRSILKLQHNDENTPLDFYISLTPVTFVFPLLHKYHDYSYTNAQDYLPAISFAWENDEGMTTVKKEIKSALSNTKKLIIIGYSFPYFNREVDKYIVGCLNDIHQKEIYVQDTNNRVEDLIENIKELRKFYTPSGYNSKVFHTQFTAKTDLTQFYMAFD